MASAGFDVGPGRYQHDKMLAAHQQSKYLSQASTAQEIGSSIKYQEVALPPRIFIPHGTTIIKEEKKGVPIMKSFREYLDKHRDMIFTIALVFIADHYLLGGALKDRLKKLLEGLLHKAETNLHKEIDK